MKDAVLPPPEGLTSGQVTIFQFWVHGPLQDTEVPSLAVKPQGLAGAQESIC